MSGQRKSKAGLPSHRRMRHDRHFVDELTQRMGEGIGRMIRITSISSNQDQPRASLGDLSDLQSSIDAHGVLRNIRVVTRLSAVRAGGNTRQHQRSDNDQMPRMHRDPLPTVTETHFDQKRTTMSVRQKGHIRQKSQQQALIDDDFEDGWFLVH